MRLGESRFARDLFVAGQCPLGVCPPSQSLGRGLRIIHIRRGLPSPGKSLYPSPQVVSIDPKEKER